jgi:sigma 54 modulation/S30EA-like ribosomal protein
VIDVRLHAGKDVPAKEVEQAREEIAALDRYADRERFEGARLTLRRAHKRAKRPYVADVVVRFDPPSPSGRALVAHTTGRTPVEAADAAAEHLRRELRRLVNADVTLRNEPRVLQKALADLPPLEPSHRPEADLKPAEERQIVHRHTYPSVPLSTLEAVNELLDMDVEFLLFRNAGTGEDVVAYRRDDGRIGLLHPSGSALADENDIVVPEPSRYSEPLTLEKARTEMDMLNHRFLYFIDAGDGRGKVLYLRHDGDYGLVETE